MGVDVVGLPKGSLPEYLSKYKEDKYSDLGGLKEPDFEAINELNPDLIIIPGTKNTINDLRVIKKNGLFNKIIELKNKGTMILGICGGYQMLGDNIMDTQGVEGEITTEEGFGFLSIDTIFNNEKKILNCFT